ncbi:MotA_ExbB domain-containing protein [Tenacibaculum sp. 190524A05c]|jgi:biopolymer transport protein ExbB/TolQ|uniref:MotA/TolQ/ExbB proton channel family protein n=1 Tax=Tenacibaculum platacis TaxID=3137852 RepID=UPI0031FB0972
MNFLIFGELFKRMNEGGALFTYPIFLILIATIALGVMTLKKEGEKANKFKELISHISLFALVWGFLGMMLGLISAFDAISAINNDIATPVLAGGLKIGLISPTFGMFVFLVGRFILIALAIKNRNK